MAPLMSPSQVAFALERLGKKRVRYAQWQALQDPTDGITGALKLALGLRETGLRNINNQAQTDHGVFQISELFHSEWLMSKPGFKEGTFGPAVPGHSAVEDHFVPGFRAAARYSTRLLKSNLEFAEAKGISSGKLRFALAAYNAGVGGALSGHRAGDVDKFTTGGDYSAWVLHHAAIIDEWLSHRPEWRVTV